ncbi:MAG: CDP-diacylglycerol--glycerol-3-phosphate 3-phosphatidyltransferase [Gammaproteobacteria bacterium]|nr:MAG: CDP-diacylglycerol--glycerol-3-phosphate 3-phosphatidyltransferase [Gammaproteobacteria bacterium]UCH41439.1 MAG: CDP-diacylglycerol--glycerol-3-phosphate 3-phosphatidyltransferase [Gammaproteobacteria bacterium]
MHVTLPTAITLFRIALIPLFVLVFYLPFSWSNVVATAIFALASFSDWVDGYLARSMQLESSFGAFLDPVADKLMVVVVIVLLVEANPSIYVALPSVVIVAREISISALREWMAQLGASTTVKVSYIGKTKTVAQMLALGFMIFAEPLMGLPIFQIGLGIYYLAAILTIASMVIYLRAAWPVITRHG